MLRSRTPGSSQHSVCCLLASCALTYKRKKLSLPNIFKNVTTHHHNSQIILFEFIIFWKIVPVSVAYVQNLRLSIIWVINPMNSNVR